MKAHDRAFLHLDLGDFAKIDEATGDYLTEFIWDTFEQMDVQAVSLGPRELTSWEVFKGLMDRGTIPVVASNVSLKREGEEVPVGRRSLVLDVNGIKVGLFSLMGGSEFATAQVPQGLEFGFHDPFQVAAELITELRKSADLVILMSQMSRSDTDRLVQSVPGIDVALYGHRPSWRQMADRLGTTVTNQTGIRGQYLGELVLIVDPKGEIIDFGSKNSPLDEKYPERASMAKMAAEAEQKSKELKRMSREERQEKFENRLSGERFIGVEKCRRCHEKQYAQWRSTPHAEAFAGLSRPVEGKPRTPACVSCHVTGYGQSGGFQIDGANPEGRPARQPDLADVQCEACHGKGTLHDRDGEVRVGESICRTCHDQEWSPGFNYKEALAAVTH